MIALRQIFNHVRHACGFLKGCAMTESQTKESWPIPAAMSEEKRGQISTKMIARLLADPELRAIIMSRRFLNKSVASADEIFEWLEGFDTENVKRESETPQSSVPTALSAAPTADPLEVHCPNCHRNIVPRELGGIQFCPHCILTLSAGDISAFPTKPTEPPAERTCCQKCGAEIPTDRQGWATACPDCTNLAIL